MRRSAKYPAFRASFHVVAFMAIVGLVPTTLEAQATQFRLGYSLSAVSTPGWSPIYGPSVGIEMTMSNGWGVGVGYGIAGRDRGEVSRYCGFAFCVDGPFDEEVFLRSFGLDVTRTALRSEQFDLRVGVRARYFNQGRHVTHLETGDEFDSGSITDGALGAEAEVRSRTAVVGLTPMSWVHLDRVFSAGCATDASCFGSRSHVEVGVGVLFGRFGG